MISIEACNATDNILDDYLRIILDDNRRGNLCAIALRCTKSNQQVGKLIYIHHHYHNLRIFLIIEA